MANELLTSKLLLLIRHLDNERRKANQRLIEKRFKARPIRKATGQVYYGEKFRNHLIKTQEGE